MIELKKEQPKTDKILIKCNKLEMSLQPWRAFEEKKEGSFSLVEEDSDEIWISCDFLLK